MRALLLAAALLAAATAGHASSSAMRFCDNPQALSAAQQDKLLRFAAIVRQELDASGDAVALVSRTGVDLQRFGLRYSHAGISLKASGNTPWSVRQLYYACSEHRPRLYDQGLAGFLFGNDDPVFGYVSIVLLPQAEATGLEQAALDNARALRLLAATYSANAYPFSLRYQNCNQWVMELLASAWGALDDADDLRARAQAWLAAQGYAPPPVDVGSRLLMFATVFFPLLHLDDHPLEDRDALQLRTSLPTSIEAFVHQRLPQARRIELCHDDRQVVIRQGWKPLADGCRAEEGDRVIAFD